MDNWNSKKMVGLRDKKTEELIMAYPEPLEGDMELVSDKVFDWYYQMGCQEEHAMEQYYVDVLNEDEIKALKQKH